MNNEYDYLFKIIIIGNSGVGKTSFLKRYTDNIYEDKHVSTIGVDFKIKTIDIDNIKSKLQLWDTAGQERFNAITQSYYRGSHGIILIFDLTNLESFKALNNWLERIEKYSSTNKEIIILGNKIDSDERIVSKEEIDLFLKEKSISNDKYYEVSAKDNILVKEVFENLTRSLIEKTKKGVFESKDKNKIKMLNETVKKGCC